MYFTDLHCTSCLDGMFVNTNITKCFYLILLEDYRPGHAGNAGEYCLLTLLN